MTQIIWSDFAIEDREAIFDHIALDSVAAAFRVDGRIREHVEMLARFPDMGRKGIARNTRELAIARTPYVAIYAINTDHVRILRVLHGAQQRPTAF